MTQGIFYGLRPTSTALISAALLGFIKMVLFFGGNLVISGINWLNLALFLGFFAIIQLKDVHPVLVIGLGAGIGIVLNLV